MQKENIMRVISMFYGILVSIFYEDDVHHLPHIHVVIRGRMLRLPSKTDDFSPEIFLRVSCAWQVWVDIHEDELMADWELAVAGDEPFRIAPLQ
jgi:hypothetical protein